MKLPDLIATGWLEIRSHKMRSFLSVFAIAIGIATFFYTLSILSQRYRDIDRTAEISGKGRVDADVEKPLSMDQYNQLLRMLPPQASLSFQTDELFTNATYKGQLLTEFFLQGLLPTWQDSAFVYQVEGRFFNWQDIKNKHRVALVIVYPREKNPRHIASFESGPEGSVQLQDFVKHINLLNQSITISNQSFTVVGILRAPPVEKDFRASEDQESMQKIFIPYSTWYDIAPSWRDSFSTHARIVAGSEDKADRATSVLRSFLRQQFGPDFLPDIRLFRHQLNIYRQGAWHNLKAMIFIGLIAMIAGGIGIMNITMVVIFSRTREIGIRRALGASRLDILLQFLTEAMLLGLCGAAGGMVLGYLAVLHMANNTSQLTFSWWVVAASVLLALGTSFLFALYPAYEASKLRPVEALKYE